ncbi:MAG: TIGR02594 family protein [Pseudomonadota bacterium]
MNTDETRALQRILTSLGHSPGPVDGRWGSMTAKALAAADAALEKVKPLSPDLPWMIEARSVFGLHETRDNATLRLWLRSDGETLGDPAALPWCGDYVDTCIRNALETEPYPSALKENPYWARNWLFFGQAVPPTYGAVLVFSRNGGGHVGFAVGQDSTDFYVLGGNQGNGVNITRIAKDRLLGSRWPATAPHKHAALPRMTQAGIPKSVNEF